MYKVVGVYPDGSSEALLRTENKDYAERFAIEIKEGFGGDWEIKVIEE